MHMNKNFSFVMRCVTKLVITLESLNTIIYGQHKHKDLLLHGTLICAKWYSTIYIPQGPLSFFAFITKMS